MQRTAQNVLGRKAGLVDSEERRRDRLLRLSKHKLTAKQRREQEGK